ncbi:MAG: hypothetical protein U0840_12070 [Gemmataceae bacterium]
MLRCLVVLALLASTSQAGPPVYLWHEPEWFNGVEGSFAYWTGTSKPTGRWGIAGPGISAEWTQGGESEWNSIGVPAAEKHATCSRDLVIPRAGTYQIWVRYVEHRRKSTPFRVVLTQAGRSLASQELGVKQTLPPNDEYLLYWGFAFGWDSFRATLPRGTVRLELVIDRPGEAWRQIDAILLTNDLKYEPVGREKPPFAYLQGMKTRPNTSLEFRGKGLPDAGWTRPKVGERDFSMWTGIELDPKWWSTAKVDSLSKIDLFHALSSPPDIRKQFIERYPRADTTPLIPFPNLLPGVYLGNSPDLSPGTPLRRWLERTKTPFYILTNYANPTYTEKTGPATFAALTGPLEKQFLGYIHGEAIGTVGVPGPAKALGATRAEHLATFARQLTDDQAREWSRFYRTSVPPEHRRMSIPCLSVESTALAHSFHEMGSKVVGYEADATNVHVPMRIAFQRGAARQFGGAWINYASGNFGDACNYFTQEPRVPRGAKGWFHSKYAVTDGVSAGWYRKMYYLNYLSGASAIYWEQGLENQWLLPGPGTHPVELSPFGRCTEEFMALVRSLPDRGDPITPVAFLLSHAHGYEPVTYTGRMLHTFPQDRNDLELRELFNIAWYPAGVVEGQPAAPDVQSMPSGVFGNIFDVLVDRPTQARAIFQYPIVWPAGSVSLAGKWPQLLREYVTQGGTLVVNAEQARQLPADLLGATLTGKSAPAETWTPQDGTTQTTTPFQVALIESRGAKPLATAGNGLPLITRHAVGKGAVILTLVPRMLGEDERAHPALGYLMHGLTQRLLPVEIRRADGSPLEGEVMYQVNRTRDGLVVLLINNQGVDKTQHGIARVDRRRFVDVIIRSPHAIASVREHTQPRRLEIQRDPQGLSVPVRVHPGDVQVVHLMTR